MNAPGFAAEFLGSTSAPAAGSLVFGFPTRAAAQGATPEVNAWVVVQPDDTVIIRIARSEMGQGTLTGLAQLVAEELECDWARVTTEYPTPGQNLARNRVWGNFSTGGSRGIRESQDYVRKGGAAARMMLVQAAADELGRAGRRVPRRQQRDHARPQRPQHHLRQGGRGGREADAARPTCR
jgi:isoquinoline 1-oxidoreductase beta subunit